MKILILLKKWEGGVGVVVNSIKKELEKIGHDVICVSREEDFKVFSSVKNLFLLRKKCKKIIKSEKPDIIYTQDWSMALPLLFPFRKYKKKHFCCFHGIQSGNSSIFQRLVGFFMGRRLIVVGDSLKKRFPRSVLVYNGINFDKFKSNKKVKKIKNSVGFVNWKTDDYSYNEIKLAVEDIGKKLVVAEGISFEKMPEFYQKLECFISLPPKCAGFNMSWIEAMGCGVPKVIGNNAGIGKKLSINKINDFVSVEDSIKNCNIVGCDMIKIKKMFGISEMVKKLLKVWRK